MMKTEQSGIMLEHILEESSLIRDMMERRREVTRDFVELFKTHSFKRIYISGTGSPSNACVVLKYAAVKLLKVETTYSLPNLFNYHEGFNVGGLFKPEEQLLLCPAESGRTKGSVIAARKAKELGIPVASTTLYPDGVLGRVSDVVIQKPSGLEIALPSTKGHTMGIFLFLLCFVEAAHALGRITEAEYQRYIDSLLRLPQSIKSAYDASRRWFCDHQDAVMQAKTYRFVGYGANYGTVREAALKFTESHERPTQCYELEDFMHGPLHAVHYDDMIFFVAAEDCPEKERMFDLVRLAQEKFTPNCVVLQSASDPERFPLSLRFDAVNTELVNAIEYLVPIQVLSYEIADHLGFDLTQWGPVSVGTLMGTSFQD